jgi:putative transposase
MEAMAELSPLVGAVAACEALKLPRASYYRMRLPLLSTVKPRRKVARALATSERQAALAYLHEERFQNCAPAAVYATLLDEGTYPCSIRTMYRLLTREGESRERRDQLTHPAYTKHELLATAPNQLWSWDITKLMGPAKWTYFYLYVILDVFSRYVVGWMVAPKETAALAKQFIAETIAKQGVVAGQLTIHADRGAVMTSQPVAFLLSDLGVTKTHSRPHISDDNPYSESQFRTMKYRPEFPERFGCIQDSRAFGHSFFAWYNEQHRHSGLALLTPEMVHFGSATHVVAQRQLVLDAAFHAHPERFVRKPPIQAQPPLNVWINKPPDSENNPN